MKRLIPLFLLLTTLVGCESVMPIIGGAIDFYIKWKEGEAHAYFATDRETAYAAVKRAIDNLNHRVAEESRTSDNDYSIIAGNNDRFNIKVVRVEPYITRVSIRVNFMGDKPYAELIYKELIDELDVIEYKMMERRLKRPRTTSTQ